MKYIAIICCCIFIGCDDKPSADKDYTTVTDSIFNTLHSPVVLIGKDKSFGLWGVTLKDGSGKITTFGNFSSLANNLGASRKVGDTLK